MVRRHLVLMIRKTRSSWRYAGQTQATTLMTLRRFKKSLSSTNEKTECFLSLEKSLIAHLAEEASFPRSK